MVRKTLRQDLTRNVKILLVFLLVFMSLALQGWVADFIKGDTLFGWWNGGIDIFSTPGTLGALGLFILSLIAAYLAYLGRATLQPVRVLDRRHGEDVKPRRVLVTALSDARWSYVHGDHPGLQLRGVERDVERLPSDRRQALEHMSKLGVSFAWEMLLRGVLAHQSRLAVLYLIPSEETNSRIAECCQFLRFWFPTLDIRSTRPVAFEDLDALLGTYRSVARDSGHPEDEIAIDVTGGTKMTSIAAALFAVQRPKIEFQYVYARRSGEKTIASFNVVSTNSEEVG